jgi:hypothetical protein
MLICKFRIELIYDYLAKIIFWNMIIRLIIESYLDFAIGSATNVQNVRGIINHNIFSWHG